MKFLLRFSPFFFLMICFAVSTRAQSTSNKGTEFYTAYMDHNNGAGATGNQSTMVLYITSDISTTGVVELADGSSPQSYSVTANQVTTVTVPYNAFLGDNSQKFNSAKGIHITAQRPVAVYAHIYALSVSGATLLLPVNTLGKDYLSLNYTQISNSIGQPNPYAYSAFVIVATEDNTTVQITPSVTLISGEQAGQSYTISLNKGEVYQGLSPTPTDLTGTHIKSISANGVACKRIAVFSGSSRININNGCTKYTSSDNLFQQVYPTSSWGKNYISAPLADRAYDVFRVVASDPTTVLTLNGAVVPGNPFAATGYYEFNSTTPNVFSADKAIQVVQYAITQNVTPGGAACPVHAGDTGDPEMIYLNPIEQGLDHVTLYSAGRYRISRSYINVIIPNTAVSSLTLDGTVVNVTATPVRGSSNYSYLQIPVTSGLQAGATGTDNGTHNLAASQNFNAIAYGYGVTESYGYSAGTDLKNLNEAITVQDSSTNQPVLSSACTNLNYKLKLTLPYTTNMITWDFKDGTTPTVQNNPVARDTVITGSTAYVYSFTKAVTFKAGSHAVVATVFKAGADECGNNEDVEFDFTVVDPPSIKFTYSNLCLGQGTTFNYSPTDTLTNKYDWDFGDGTAHSTDQNPMHVYAASGNYQVVLAVTGPTGCSNISNPLTVHISKKPTANFTPSSPDCETGSISFKDTSTDPEGNKVIAWSWDFGDGITSAGQNPTHIFATAGTYKIKLVVTNDKGCQGDTTTIPLIIHPTPVADFTAPDICLNDGKEQFTNASDFKGDPQTGFTNSWNFGDTGSAANTSTQSDPQHAYSRAGVYTVTLVIKSPFGCISSITSKQIIVNASTPAASFAISNPTGLCASNPVVFQDRSTKSTDDVITKVVWHWGDGTADSTYDKNTIHKDGYYNHSYPFASSTPISRTFTVTLDEYTGLTCVSTISQMITVNANPVVALTSLSSICQEASQFQIVEKTTFSGMGVFSGTGVTAKGVFNPYKAGPGSYTINYLFTANNTGCTYADSVHIIVYPTPVVTVGNDFKLLDGDTTKLIATAVGDSLSYNWYPSAGLNRDDILNPIASPNVDTKYTLTVTSAKGCSSFASVYITVLKLPKVPNTFTPNGDGVNDFWVIDQLNKYPDATVEVYSRNGDKVYSSVGYSVPWDGKFKGADLPVGVYYYIINPKERRKTMSGYVTIIR